MSVPSARLHQAAATQTTKEGRGTFNSLLSTEWVFAVVGPVGSGTTFVASALANLASQNTKFRNAEIIRIKASDEIRSSLTSDQLGELDNLSRLQVSAAFQDAGDALRKRDRTALAMKLMLAIKRKREESKARLAASTVLAIQAAESVDPTRIYIIDSLKNPSEVELLRGIYRESFCLIGVVCETKKRQERLQHGKCSDSTQEQILAFMKRDESAS